MDIFVSCQSCPEGKEKLNWIQKLDTILSTVTTTWSKTMIIAEYTNIDQKNHQLCLKYTKK